MSRLAALLHAPLRAAPVSARAVSRSCAGEIPPPAAPPRAPRPRQPCRPPPPCSDNLAEHRVCCAPPRSRQPPCPARPPAAPRTCAAARAAPCDAETCEEPCGGQDRVALRLAAADAARRRQYEEEAAQRAAAGGAPPPSAEYAPGAARDCLRAVDGRTYSLPCRLPPLPRCGPGRTPPPSRAVPLAREPGCRLERERDPCSHRPPVFLDVDRSSSQPAPRAPPAPPSLPEPRAPGACAPPRPAPRGLTQRIVSGLRGDRPPERSLHSHAPRGRLLVPSAGRCARGGRRRRASWPSIGSICERLAGCGGGGADSPPKKPACPSKKPAPCPAKPSCPPAAPPKRSKAPSCPGPNKPVTSPCDKAGSKTKFIPVL